MNPLTQIKNTQKISKQEIAAGVKESQSWHARFKHSAYIYTGGLPFNLTDGDLLAVFSQYGEVIDVNLIRSRETGKSRGFAFLAYQDQRSTNLAVDNLNGAKIGGRIVTVDHVDNYKRKIAEVEGREVSESEDDDEEGQAMQARDAATNEAELDGAQVVAMTDTLPRTDEAGATGGAAQDAPWASKSSVYSLLNSKTPARPIKQLEDEEDPMLAMKREKKHRKEDKKKKSKEDRHKVKKEKKEKRDRR